MSESNHGDLSHHTSQRCPAHCPKPLTQLSDIPSLDHEIERLLAATITPLRRARNGLSGACRVPAEILRTIIRLCAPDGDPNKIAARNSLSHVCSAWRQVALGDWTLWSDIDLGKPPMSRELFARCSGAPVVVHLAAPTVKSDDPRAEHLVDALLHAFEHAEHIEQLDLAVTASLVVHEIEPLVMKQRPKFTRLARAVLNLHHNQDQLAGLGSLFDVSAPSLQDLQLSDCPIDWGTSIIQNLRYLTLHSSSESEPLVDEFQWTSILTTAPLVSLEVCDRAVPDILLEHALLMPHLTDLKFYGTAARLIRLMHSLNMPLQETIFFDPYMSRTANQLPTLSPMVREFFAEHDQYQDTGGLSVTYQVHSYKKRTLTLASSRRKIDIEMQGFLRNDEFVMEEFFEHLGPAVVDRVQTLRALHGDRVDFYTDYSTWSGCFTAFREVREITVSEGSAGGLYSLWQREPDRLLNAHTLRVIGLDPIPPHNIMLGQLLAALQARKRTGHPIKHLIINNIAEFPLPLKQEFECVASLVVSYGDMSPDN